MSFESEKTNAEIKKYIVKSLGACIVDEKAKPDKNKDKQWLVNLYARHQATGSDDYVDIENRCLDKSVLYNELTTSNQMLFEVSQKYGYWLKIPDLPATKPVMYDIHLNETYKMGPGLYIVMGPAESGKSTFLYNHFSSDEFSVALLLENFLKDNKVPWTMLKSYSSATDLVAIENFLRIAWKSNRIPVIDSLKTLFSFNDKPIMAEGVPVGPFDLLNRIDIAAFLLNRIVIGTVPIPSEKESAVNAFYKQAALQTSGVFLPNAKGGNLKFTIRNCYDRQRRIATQIISL